MTDRDALVELIYRKSPLPSARAIKLADEIIADGWVKPPCNPIEDAVEVVRCKDCKHYKVGNLNADYCYHERHEHHAQGTSYSPDDFCSYGERRME